ncbi:FumA C-terminus/TtdB family hydratase beta subunit [Pyrofollis japonicus]|uniref:FumA C-terminus/TtdB family hydratase beta subunit n=1 Tax=Pyrofollis japonicus TaxID=3060460 RepID=UPI00295B433B|nr:FumA C-terminus/TtdB family hydratase beta subunit [Pyrofollis japonicus]BEP18315.1 FumA C-terminus/TtdB family hydratase beta subunit [Pyrofollis japonicus]
MARIYHLRTPLSEEDVRQLRVGDTVYLSGIIFTARDAAHRKILDLINRGEPLPFDPKGLAVYHVGPVVRKKNSEWEVIAAGPTTSARLEPVEHEFIAKTGVRMVIGKGGMGKKTAEACKKYGAVYAVFTGGAAVLAAQAIKRVVDVYWLDELGIPEAVWLFEVENFGPLTVTIDSTGKNYYDEILENAKKKAQEILAKLQ